MMRCAFAETAFISSFPSFFRHASELAWRMFGATGISAHSYQHTHGLAFEFFKNGYEDGMGGWVQVE